MKSITIDHDSVVPAYQQIADELRGLVARGLFEPGETLPSVRRLGQQLGVNLNTVAKAYRVLADEGIVELRQGAAARLRMQGPPSSGSRFDDEVKQTLHRMIDRLVLHGADRKQVERTFAAAVNEYFRAVRTAKGSSK